MFKARNANNHDHSVVEALNASMAMIEFSPSGQILGANANFLEAVGYNLGEIRGQHHSIFCDRDYVTSPAYGEFWRDLAAGVFKADRFKRFRKDKAAIWLQATYNPVRDEKGRVTSVIKFAADVTLATLAEMDSRGKIDAINRSQAVIEFSPDGMVLGANANFLTTLGYTVEEIKGQHHSFFCDPVLVQSTEYRQFWAALARGEYQAAEFRRIGKGGREIYIQASYNPVFDDTGKIVKVVKFATDITATVHKRQRGEQLNRELGAVVGEINAASEMATSASNASHETGNIVSSVAAAAVELSQSVHAISDSMSSAKANVEGVSRNALNANRSAETLNTSAAAMNSIVTLIQGIASQINLLALNATIESARAGEAGRGFAVVATEVKSLANQAASSTKTIAEEINRMQTVTTDVVGALGEISASMSGLMENVSSVASAIEQQSAVTYEISENMNQAVSAVHDIDSSLSNISTTFTHVSEASDRVKKEMDSLAA
ncbi:MAG: methyl-accepting chemotaxis protein [Asticcacaulis sp.]